MKYCPKRWYFTPIPLLKPVSIPVCILLCVSCQTQPAPWSFDTHIGVVAGKADLSCLAIRNSTLPPNSQIQVVMLTTPQTTTLAPAGPPDPSCAGGAEPSGDLHGYRVQLEKGASSGQAPAIGILDYRGSFRKDGDLLSADLDRDGKPEYFRFCLSAEGVHYTVWTGKPLTGQLRWHQYQYLGYDVEPTCKPEETLSPK